MQPITPHLWFDTQAKEATELYVSLFRGSKINSVRTIQNTPSGDCDIVSFELVGQSFMAISAGPYFKINPSVSFHVKCETKEEVVSIWETLSQHGKVLMELGAYPWSEQFGWVQDRYGVSWQLSCVRDQNITQAITPVLTFVGDVCGKTEEAIALYTSLFPESGMMNVMRYGQNEAPEKEGSVKYAAFRINGQEFGAMDSARPHTFAFNEAISFIVHCETQEEIDRYWNALSAVPQSEQCGWLKDRFGLSWQIVPTAMDEMMRTGSEAQIGRVTQAFLKMKKFDLATLQKAFAIEN